MTKEEFKTTKHFEFWGFVKPLDPQKGGRYTHVQTVYDKTDCKYYDILCDDQMNFYYFLHFPHGVVVKMEGGVIYDD